MTNLSINVNQKLNSFCDNLKYTRIYFAQKCIFVRYLKGNNKNCFFVS